MKIQVRYQSFFIIGIQGVLVALVAALVGCTPDVKDLREMGISQYRNRQYIESMATFGYALECAPSDAQANYYMGLNYRAQAGRKFREGNAPAACRELDTAIYYFTQAIKTWPNYMAATASKNEALEIRGKYDDALVLAERVAKNNRGEAEHFVYLGNEYRQRGDYDRALRSYKLALAADPDSATAYAEMGRLYMRIGDRMLATDSLQRAYELNVAEPGVSEELAQLSEPRP